MAMKLGTKEHEGEGTSSQVTRKTRQQKQPPVLVFF